jgi:hypothetical protein
MPGVLPNYAIEGGDALECVLLTLEPFKEALIEMREIPERKYLLRMRGDQDTEAMEIRGYSAPLTLLGNTKISVTKPKISLPQRIIRERIP